MIKVIPEPKKIDLTGNLTYKLLSLNLSGATDARLLADAAAFGDFLGLSQKGEPIKLIIDGEVKGYCLSVNSGVTIRGDCEESLFHGLQTLKQIIFAVYKDGSAELPCLEIEDSAAYPYRGFMLDVVRHFFPITYLYKLIDVLALIKINTLHLHLTDDQGWRVEIKSCPELTEVGAYRSQTNGDGVKHGGFYTQEELKGLVAYARDKYIDIVPEFDMPGHFTAVLAAYPELGCLGQRTEVATEFGIHEDIACGGKEATYAFIEKVIGELTAIFPSKYVHIGGDEAPKYHWENCADCNAVIQKESLSGTEALQGFFTNRIIELLAAQCKTAIVWNESLNSGILDSRAVVQYWRDGKKAERVGMAAKEGRRFIISQFSPFYLDYPHGMNPLKKLYEFDNPLTASTALLGYESPLWTEYVATEERADFLTFPRELATAELGWGRVGDYWSFSDRATAFFKLLDAMGVGHATIKEATPRPFAALCSIMRFAGNLINRNAIKGLLKSMKNDRRMSRQRKNNN